MSRHGLFEDLEEVVVIEYNEHENLDDLFLRQRVSRFETCIFEGLAFELDRRIGLPVQNVKKGVREPLKRQLLIVAHDRAAMLYFFPE